MPECVKTAPDCLPSETHAADSVPSWTKNSCRTEVSPFAAPGVIVTVCWVSDTRAAVHSEGGAGAAKALPLVTHAEAIPPAMTRTRASHVLVAAAVRETWRDVVLSHAVHALPFSRYWTS